MVLGLVMLDKLLELIAEKLGKSKEEVWELIEKKRRELDYLISEEGAAHIIASELGIEITPEVKVKDLKPGMKGFDIELRILRVFEARSFEAGERKGKVRNVIAGDETGIVRLSLWDEKAELDLKRGDAVKISNAYCVGPPLEIRVGRRSSLVKLSKSNLPEADEIAPEVKERKLAEVEVGELVSVRAALVQVFNRSPFFEKAGEKELIIAGVLDDGSASIRAVFFGRNAEKILGISKERVLELLDVIEPEELLKKVELGKEWKITGRVKFNEIFETKEIIANNVEEVNPREEVEKILDRLIGVE